MLWREPQGRPDATLVELNAEEVTKLPDKTVPDYSDELSLATLDCDLRADRQGSFHLNTDSRSRDVFQIRHSTLFTLRFVCPANLD